MPPFDPEPRDGSPTLPGSNRALAWLGLACALAACSPAGESQAPPAAPRPQHRYSLEQFLATVTYGGASFAPDGSKVLVHSDADGVFNLYALPVDGGEAEQLTHSTTDSLYAEGYFPEDERVLFRSDHGGDELDHLYVREVDGRVRDLTPGPGHRAVFGGWADDGRRLYLGTNERDARFFDLYEVDASTYERRLVFRNDEGLEFADVSPDGRWFALARIHSGVDADLCQLDRRTGLLEVLTAHEEDIDYRPLAYAPSGRRLLYLTDEAHEFRYLAERDLESGATRIFERSDGDVLFAEYSRSGRYLVVGVNADAHTQVRVLDLAAGRDLSLAWLPEGEITEVEIAADDSRMAFFAATGRSPRDLFVQDLPDGQPRQLTYALSPDIDPEDLVEPEAARFAADDGLEIPGLLYRPHQAAATAPAPALVWVHDGPGGQSRVAHDTLLQYLVHEGYAVHAVNHRGSSGYGKTFARLDDRAHGEGDLADCLASGTRLAAIPWIDPERIGIVGSGYGGYLVLAALAFRPEAFALGVDLFGVSNWGRTLQSLPPWWESRRPILQQEMGDSEDAAYLRSISPLFVADRIQRPLLVLHGANDPRVLPVESSEMVSAVRTAGAPAKLLVFEDEGHGLEKKANRARAYAAIRAFLEEHLGSSGAPSEEGGPSAQGSAVDP